MHNVNSKVFQRLAKDMNYYDYSKYTPFSNFEVWHRILYDFKSVDTSHAGVPCYIWARLISNYPMEMKLNLDWKRNKGLFLSSFDIYSANYLLGFGHDKESIMDWRYRQGITDLFLFRWVGEYEYDENNACKTLTCRFELLHTLPDMEQMNEPNTLKRLW